MTAQAARPFSFWSGRVTWMERLCAASAASVGQALTIFSYEPAELRKTGMPGTIVDANEVCDLSDAFNAHLKENSPRHYVDYFRLVGLQQQRGTWVDLDCVLVRPLPDQLHLFGWERDGLCGAAILRLPPDSPTVAEFLAFLQVRPFKRVLPTWPWPRRLSQTVKHYRRLALGRPATPISGPEALTCFATRNGVLDLALPKEVFYPVDSEETLPLVSTGPDAGAFITPRTVAVHLWHTMFLRRHGASLPPPASWLGKQCRALGVTH